MWIFAGPTYTKWKTPLERASSAFKVIVYRSLFDINVFGCVVISAGDGMDFFVFFLSFLVSKVHLVIRLLFVKLLIQPHIFLKNIFQLGFTFIKGSVVVILDLFVPILCLFDCWDLAFFFWVCWQAFITQTRRGFTMRFWIRIGFNRLFEVG